MQEHCCPAGGALPSQKPDSRLVSGERSGSGQSLPASAAVFRMPDCQLRPTPPGPAVGRPLRAPGLREGAGQAEGPPHRVQNFVHWASMIYNHLINVFDYLFPPL